MSATPSIIEDNQAYEAWLRQRCRVVEQGLEQKHEKMAKSAFKFFRATCFRFARLLPAEFPGFSQGPAVPSVGDAHIENWGTWRDAEGRLVWGVNDFDEAAVLPYMYDLVRLATNARLAGRLPLDDADAAKAIMNGYRRGLEHPGPFLVDDAVDWFKGILHSQRDERGHFEADLAEAGKARDIPPAVVELLTAQLPAGTSGVQFRAWQRGGGSLGRPRYLAMGTWRGGRAIREAKALVPSAWDWMRGRDGDGSLFMAMATGDYRSPDPFLLVHSNYIVRRLAPDSRKINLAEKEAAEYNQDLLSRMGADLAAIHLSGHKTPSDIIDDVRQRNSRKPNWLNDAAAVAEAAVVADFKVWKEHWEDSGGRPAKRG